MDQSLKTLFFEHDARGETVQRLRVPDTDVPAVALSMNQIQRRLRRDIEVVEALTTCARAKQELVPELARDAAHVIDDLARVVNILANLEQLMVGGGTPVPPPADS